MNEIDIWPPAQNFPVPICHTRWQNELNRVAGFAPNRLSILRLEWGSNCTWTNYVPDLKYHQRDEERQIGWAIDVYDNSGTRAKTQQYSLTANIPPPDKNHGVAYPIMEKRHIGIPRFWISQYTPPSLVGDTQWEEARLRLISSIGAKADMGAFPREGFYYRGFHLIAYHDSICCSKAKTERRKCFGYYRDPSDLDILYVQSLLREREQDTYDQDWTYAATDRDMYRTLKTLNEKHNAKAGKEREEMKLRIKDAFKTYKARLTSRKSKNTWIFTPDGKVY